MSYLLKTKYDCRTKLSFISHQQPNHNQLFQNVMPLQSHQKLTKPKKSLPFSWHCKHHNENGIPKQVWWKAFKGGLMESEQDEHKIELEKSSTMDDIWLKATKMQDFCIHHKIAFSQHILRLQSNAKEQSPKPFPKNFNVDVNLSSCFKSFMIFV